MVDGSGRNALSWEEKFALDVWYVDNHTLWLDLKIIFLALLKIVKRDGISQAGISGVGVGVGRERPITPPNPVGWREGGGETAVGLFGRLDTHLLNGMMASDYSKNDC